MVRAQIQNLRLHEGELYVRTKWMGLKVLCPLLDKRISKQLLSIVCVFSDSVLYLGGEMSTTSTSSPDMGN